MLGNFKYSNPTKIYFGKDSLNYLKDELKKYGEKILLVYGGGSIKKNGIYDAVTEVLKEEGKKIFELPGVMPNPTVEKLYEGAKVAKDNEIDFILAIGGGSVCDYSKAVSVSAYCEEDPWDKFFIKFEEPDNKIIPVGCILTMVGTGSEMNGGSVITNHDQKLKIGHIFNEDVMPKFSILNPTYTYTVPKYQMVSGIFDIMSHIIEQYFSGTDDNTSDYIAEGLLKSLIKSSKVAIDEPENYEARSNIMWTATMALNTMIAMGKTSDWMVHMIGQSIGAYTNATHGMTLSSISIPYYRYIMPYGLDKFKRYAINVWDVKAEGKTDEEIAMEGLKKMSDWMKEIGVVMNPKDLGMTEEMIEGIAEKTLILNGGYKILTKDDIVEVLKEALKG
ncbi:iron-containing alcohol dehydrogenase [Fusobacterium sp. MFO224]|uniref:iron-containing alcohol dehydrogenase n=1 Tax=Fusobacterium sp. MFO224 TaxID=3378070 RepID=UPI003851A69D